MSSLSFWATRREIPSLITILGPQPRPVWMFGVSFGTNPRLGAGISYKDIRNFYGWSCYPVTPIIMVGSGNFWGPWGWWLACLSTLGGPFSTEPWLWEEGWRFAGTQALASLATTQGPRGRKGRLETQTNCWYFLFSPRILGEMIQFDLRIIFKWVGEKPPTSLVAAVPQTSQEAPAKQQDFLEAALGPLDSFKAAENAAALVFTNPWKDMDVSKNRGIPKWMVYNGKPY